MAKRVISARLTPLLLIIVLIAGCGYTIRPHPSEDIHYSIRVEKFLVNEFQEGKELDFTNLLIEKMLSDGRLTVVEINPDLILSGENFRLQHEVVSPSGPFEGTYQVRVAAKIKLQNIKEDKTLWEGELGSTSPYVLETGTSPIERRQLQQEAELEAMEMLANKVVGKVIGILF